MIKASALSIVIIVSLIIAVCCSALITTAYFYRLEAQKSARYHRLHQNLESAIAMLLAGDPQPEKNGVVDLFGEQSDSLRISSEAWGAFTAANAKSFVLGDTLKRAFLIGYDQKNDTTALYLSDEDRPLSISGDTRITGDALLPKSGLRTAYVEGRPYTGRRSVYGNIRESTRKLPEPDKNHLDGLLALLSESRFESQSLPDSISNSFFNQTLVIRLPSDNAMISGTVHGKIILLADTTIVINGSASLKDVLIVAPSAVVKKGFRGRCQIFASNSVTIERDCSFGYPSCVGVLKAPGEDMEALISLGESSRFDGILFTHEPTRSNLQTRILLGKNCNVMGEVFATGFIEMEKPLSIRGKLSCNRFIMRTPATLYQNYLIDIKVDRRQRSKYYLTSPLFKAVRSEAKVLDWLE